MDKKRVKKFTFDGDTNVRQLSNTVPKLPRDDMLTLFGEETYQKILDGFNGPAYDVNGDRVTPMSLFRMYGREFDSLLSKPA